MIEGILQRLRITERTQTRLVLREYPLLEWLVVGALLLGAINMFIFGLTLTATGAVVIAAVLVLITRMRTVIFDQTHDHMIVAYRYPLLRRTVNTIPLERVLRAYLFRGDDEYTQVVLVTTAGEMGMSVYSRDVTPWKEEIVFTINEFLHAARIAREKDADPDTVATQDVPPVETS